MTPRHLWFKQRIDECLNHLTKLNETSDWIEFKDKAYELACELIYATTEWNRYYKDCQDDCE